MYSKQEATMLTQQFWTSFGQYMVPVLSAEGEKINWVNYKTGVKDTRFTMMATTASAKISITLSHNDTALQNLYFQKFVELERILHTFLEEQWQWQQNISNEHGKTISEIFIILQPVNVLNSQHWPAIISFLKPRMIALDKFWCGYKYAFEGMGL